MKVFIVDDDSNIVEVMTLLLEAAGHVVEASTIGAEAIPRIRRSRPDLVIADLMMAELDGLALCRELRTTPELAGMKIVFNSARSHQMWRDKAMAAGADGYLTKPVDPIRFVDELTALAG